MELTFSHLYMFEATSLTCLCQLEFWNQVNCWKGKMLYYQSTSFDFLSVLYCWLNHTLFLYLAEPSTILAFLNSILCSFSFSVSCCVWLFLSIVQSCFFLLLESSFWNLNGNGFYLLLFFWPLLLRYRFTPLCRISLLCVANLITLRFALNVLYLSHMAFGFMVRELPILMV